MTRRFESCVTASTFLQQALLWGITLLLVPVSARAQGLETQFDSMPILTTKLVLICNGDRPEPATGSTWIRTVATSTIPQNGSSDTFVHVPGSATPISRSGATTTTVLAVQMPNIRTVGELESFEFEVPESACVDAFYLQFNDRFMVVINSAVGRTGRPPTRPNSNARPGNILVFGVTKSFIQAEAARQSRDVVCALPLKIYPETVQATIEGIIGNQVIRNPETYFTRDDYVAIAQESDASETAAVEFTVHSSRGSARLLVGLGISCGPSQPTEEDPNPTGSSITLEVGRITVQAIDDADGLTTIADALGLAKGVLEDEINAQMSGLRDGLGELVRNLPLCPRIRFIRSYEGEAEPSVFIEGLPILPPSLVIDEIPDLTVLGLPPVTLCN